MDSAGKCPSCKTEMSSGFIVDIFKPSGDSYLNYIGWVEGPEVPEDVVVGILNKYLPGRQESVKGHRCRHCKVVVFRYAAYEWLKDLLPCPKCGLAMDKGWFYPNATSRKWWWKGESSNEEEIIDKSECTEVKKPQFAFLKVIGQNLMKNVKPNSIRGFNCKACKIITFQYP